MRKILLSLFILVALLFSYKFAIAQEKALDFTLKDINQQTVNLSNYKDKKPLLLFFWTTWCPFCLRELRKLNNIYTDLVKDDLEVLAINVGESSDEVDKFIKNYNLSYRVLLDEGTDVVYTYEIVGVPTYILINKKGYIVFKDNYFPQSRYKDLIAQ